MHLHLSELKTRLLLSEYSSGGGGGLSRVCAEVHCSVYQLTVQLAKCLPQQTMHTVRMYVCLYLICVSPSSWLFRLADKVDGKDPQKSYCGHKLHPQ